ncbi:MAG: flavin reductase family protein [Phycicoccus sp.]
MDDVAFRAAMATTPSPVTVVTTSVDGGQVGCTVSAFMSLSLSPRMVAVALDDRSSVLGRIHERGAFGVNVLAAGQSELAMGFAQSRCDRFAGVPWWPDAGLPRLAGTSAWLACRLQAIVRTGDHHLLVGEVTDTATSALPPLVYAERRFGHHSGLQERPIVPVVRQLAACAS